MAAVLSRRERKKAQTRQALVDAALHLFVHQGFDDTTVEEITEAADVAQRTFFRHFPSKDAVVFHDQPEMLTQITATLRRRPHSETPIESVREAVLAVAQRAEENKQLHLLQARLAEESETLAAYLRSVVQRDWEYTLRDWIAERLNVDPLVDLRPVTVASAAVGAVRAASGRWVAGHGHEQFPDLVVEAFALLEPMRARGTTRGPDAGISAASR